MPRDAEDDEFDVNGIDRPPMACDPLLEADSLEGQVEVAREHQNRRLLLYAGPALLLMYDKIIESFRTLNNNSIVLSLLVSIYHILAQITIVALVGP